MPEKLVIIIAKIDTLGKKTYKIDSDIKIAIIITGPPGRAIIGFSFFVKYQETVELFLIKYLIKLGVVTYTNTNATIQERIAGNINSINF